MRWRRTDRLLAGLILSVACSLNFASAEETGLQLYKRCLEGEGDQRHTVSGEYNGVYCSAYIAGVWDGFAQAIPANTPLVCVNRVLTYGDIALIFMKWARKSPEFLSHDASLSVIAAMSDAFRCPGK